MKPEKILMVHNYYQLHGGEEESFRAEMSMLLYKEHDVITYTRSNDEIQVNGVRNKAKLFFNTIWAKDSHKALAQLIREQKPRLAHFQNIFPLISPSVYYACKDEQIPVIQSLRNYRMICSNGFFFRNGKICEDCTGKLIHRSGHGVVAQYENISEITSKLEKLLLDVQNQEKLLPETKHFVRSFERKSKQNSLQKL